MGEHIRARGLLALTALALGGLAAGCGGGGGTCGDGTIQVEWTVNGQSAAAACATVGATKVALTVDGSSMAKFDCTAGGGQTPFLAPGPHDVSIALLAADGHALDSLPATSASVPCGGVVDVGAADFQAQACDAPAVGATWSIDKQATGAGLTCEQAAGTTVELTLNGTPFDFACGAYQGLTTTLAPGSYTADFVLLDAAGNVLSQTSQMTINVKSCGVTDLGDVLFDVQ